MKLLSQKQSQIVNLLKEHPRISVDEIVLHLGEAKTAVRRQLLSMEKRGLVQREYHPSGRGRPCLVFSLTSGVKRLFPSKEAEVLSDLLAFLIQDGQEDLLERFFEDYWQKRLQSILSEIRKRGRDDFDTRLDVLCEALEREGFMPSARLQKRGKEVLLRECHCPLEAATQVTELPCRLEQRLISKVLNAPLDTIALRSAGVPACEFRLPVSRSQKAGRR